MVFKKQSQKEEQEEEERPVLKPLVKEEPREAITLVVKEIPTEPVRTAVGKDEKEYDFVTIEEALTEILANQREILKFVKS